MKPTLEQIKTDESVWPDRATHHIQDEFIKWVGGQEYSWSPAIGKWVAELSSWDLEKYEQKGCKIIPRPIKSERELFVEAGVKTNRNLGIGATQEEMFEALYDAGCRFMETDK